MRKTLFAMLGLVALGLWALPTMAAVSDDPLKDPPKASAPISPENRAGIWQSRTGGSYQGTLSGTLIKQTQATTAWFLYPGACADRANGTWVPKNQTQGPLADSLNSYTPGTTGPYTVADLSLSEALWHVSDNATCNTTGAGTNLCPPAIAGTRMLWCGKYDGNWVNKYGYPNITYQILYIDTGAHGATYNLTMDYNFSSEYNYDFIYVVGGGGGLVDPLGNDRATLDTIIKNAGHLIEWTGNISPSTANATGGSTIGARLRISDNPSTGPITVTGASFQIDASNRALYFIFYADCLYSSEDGLWPFGHGAQIDNIGVNGVPIYAEQAAAGGTDAVGGNVILGTGANPIISARVAPGIGTLWQLVAGNLLPTPDICTPKNTSSDLIFEGGNAATFHTVPAQYNAVLTCSFPIPVGTASVLALWDEYLDLPRNQGYVQQAEYRVFKDASWGNWQDTSAGGGVRTGARQAWGPDFDELAAATQADSVQIRYIMQCIPFFAADHLNCGDVSYGILYDNFRLEVVTGVPQPIFGIFVGSVAQSMFVDGTMAGIGAAGTSCTPAVVAAGECWPGTRGSSNPGQGQVHDNFNSPLGDSITVSVVTGLRTNGKGVNWHHGFDKNLGFGLTIAHTNPNYNAAADVPRIIYRIFDPATKAWSPFDSSELDANSIGISVGDTVLIDSEYRVNWPPRDRITPTADCPASDCSPSLKNGFSVNGKTLYSQLKFLPRGSRLQYYFKGVDMLGGTSYQFSSDALAREVDDLPLLPCQTGDPGCTSGGVQPGNHNSITAPDIVEFDVLPRVWVAGAGGTQLAGRTNTPLLDLDGSYTRWNYGAHATVQALRTLGVRVDRYRTLQGFEEGGHIGGHEFPGRRVGRFSNYFPNMLEYGIKDSLANWYRIMIESSHTSTSPVDEDSDARLIKEWWQTETPAPDGGDRCVLGSGDDFFSSLLAIGGVPHPDENLLPSIFGVAASGNTWNGNGTIAFPQIKDLFADPTSGPLLGSGSFAYFIDGGCPAPNRFDNLTKTGGGESQNSALFPAVSGVTHVAGVSYSTEKDAINDHDRNKALGYGFSLQFIRQGGENLVDTRAQVLYKFLTGCRGPRTVSDTASCWPCPTAPDKYSNWATATGFNTALYGPLYPLQDATKVLSAVDPAGAPPVANRLDRNFPNPFNPSTLIRFSAARAGRADVRIFDVAGRLVQTITKDATKGVNEVHWNGTSHEGRNLASGVYFVKVKYADGSESLNGLKIAIVR